MKFKVTVTPPANFPPESQVIEASDQLQAVAVFCEELNQGMFWGHLAEECKWEVERVEA